MSGMPVRLKNADGSDVDLSASPMVQGDLADGVTDTGTNPVKIGGVAATTPTSRSVGSRIAAWFGRTGAMNVTLVPQDGTIPIPATPPGRGSSATLLRLSSRSALEVSNGTTNDPVYKAQFHRLLSAAASDNASSIKNSAGELFAIRGFCSAGSNRYLKFYNKSSTPLSSDTPVLTILLESGKPFCHKFGSGFGAYFSSGIGYRITVGQADNDTGALTAGDVSCVSIDYA